MATAIFRPYDPTNSERTLHSHSGERVEVTGEMDLGHDEFNMFTVRFPDGSTGEAFDEELTEWEG